MLSIRLTRTGKKKYPVYSLIVTEKTRDPWGKYTEKLGIYNPHTKTSDIKAERVQYWISKGAQPSETAHNLLVTLEIIKADKVRAGKSQPGKKRLAEIAASKKAAEDAKQAAEDAKVKAEEERLAAEEAAKAPKAEEASAEAVVVEEAVAGTPVEAASEAVVEEAKTE